MKTGTKIWESEERRSGRNIDKIEKFFLIIVLYSLHMLNPDDGRTRVQNSPKHHTETFGRIVLVYVLYYLLFLKTAAHSAINQGSLSRRGNLDTTNYNQNYVFSLKLFLAGHCVYELL